MSAMRETTSAHAGQKIMQDAPVDKSSFGHKGYEDRPMKGGASDLSHSLGGASAKQEANDGNSSKVKSGPR